MAKINEIRDALVALDSSRLLQLVQSALDEGQSAEDILNQGLIAAMDIVGGKMETGDMFIPEVLMCAKTMNSAIAILEPFLTEKQIDDVGRVLIGTVKGDLHDIGKNLVAMMLESCGYQVFNIGIDIAPETFVECIKEHKPHILAISALLTTTMPMMKATIEAVEQSGLRNGIKIIVGGAPVSNDFAQQIGADGYAADAGAAMRLTKQLLIRK